jgi:hypothetical protein
LIGKPVTLNGRYVRYWPKVDIAITGREYLLLDPSAEITPNLAVPVYVFENIMEA